MTQPTGRALAERLGYSAGLLNRVPAEALASFAGAAYLLDLAELTPGQRVVSLGLGSATDAFAAAALVGPSGRVTGVGMTAKQVATAVRLCAGAKHLRFLVARLDDLPFVDASVDVVMGNGVLHRHLDPMRVVAESARVLAPGGRLVIADIVAAGSDYRHVIGAAGLKLRTSREVIDHRHTSHIGAIDHGVGPHVITLAADRY